MDQEMPLSTTTEQKKSSLPMIYILGNSHSGSTLLSFLLSFHPGIVNLGELKAKTWLRNRMCSCGQPSEICPFYGGYLSTFNALKSAALKNIRLDNPLHFIFKKKIIHDPSTLEKITAFYQSLSDRASTLFPNASYLIDSSKSIWLLNAWLQTMPAKDIRIIWIKRQTKASVASFVKRGSPFLSSLLSLLVNERITKHFLNRNKLDYLEVNYDQFFDAYADEAAKISGFLGVDLPVVNEEHKNHHVISGNLKTRKAFIVPFAGLHQDNEWERILSPMQKTILKWIS